MVLPSMAGLVPAGSTGWNCVSPPPARRTARASPPPLPPATLPTLPAVSNRKASGVASWPTSCSKPANPVPSTVPALAPVMRQAVWSRSAAGPVRVSVAALPPTTLSMRAKTGRPLAAPVSRLTVTAVARPA